MSRPTLNAIPRTALGKKVKKLRRDGQLPANVYGKGLASLAIQVATKDFKDIFSEVGETGLIDLKVNEQTHPVLVKNLQMDFRSNTPLHVDFYEVNLKEKVKAMVPLVLVGEAKAVAENVGTLLQTLNEVEVEALPTELPENIEVNIENLAEVDDQITIADLATPTGVTILTDEGQVVAKIAEIVVEETPEPEAAEGTEGEEGTEKPEGEVKEGEAPEEKSESQEEKSSEEKSE
ncbi:MAG TPA: 50S ribosomal protein L25 [Patescibacteria group bacterium]|nr:50S ribosomal protein L25 [Patescibacteria group bacterium]